MTYKAYFLELRIAAWTTDKKMGSFRFVVSKLGFIGI